MSKVLKISGDSGIYKELICLESETLPVEPIIETFKYLGKHYGFLVFVSIQGNSLIFQSNDDYSFLNIGDEYEFKL